MSGESNALIDIGNIFYPSEFKQENLSNRIEHFEHKERFDIGPFAITPYLADHSAFGACSLLVECDGRRIFYTGDFRGHGRKGKLFDAFVKKPIQGVDCLLMEGTTIGGNHNVGYASEDEVEKAVRQIIRSQQDACFITAAGSNIDRTVSIYRAAMAAEKTLVLDLYQYHLLKTLKNFSNGIPPHSWDDIRIYYVWYHADKIVDHLDRQVLLKYKSRKIERDEIIERRKNMVLRLPLSTMTRLAGKMNGERSLDGANYIYSMWSGYLKSDPAFRNFCDKYKIPMSIIHTSGHAYLEDLKRLASALKPKKTIPIHTLSGDSFGEYFPNVVRLEDKETFHIE